ncbi:MAG: molybdenum cofactor biosynthesis protein B [Terriglobia bacterium]
MKIAVLTVSDKGSRGERDDTSGDYLKEMAAEAGVLAGHSIVPDEQVLIERKLIEFADGGVNLILTTGGTGFSSRDVTPEATLAVSDREAPGIAEAIRAAGLEITPFAMLSRATAGLRGQTLIINFPGSLKSVRESFEVVKPVLSHALEMIEGKEH